MSFIVDRDGRAWAKQQEPNGDVLLRSEALHRSVIVPRLLLVAAGRRAHDVIRAAVDGSAECGPGVT